MPTRDTWSYEYDPESQMYNLWWDDDDRGAIGEVYTEAYAELIVSDHNKSLSLSTEQEPCKHEPWEKFVDILWCPRCGAIANAQVIREAREWRTPSKLTPKTEEV